MAPGQQQQQQPARCVAVVAGGVAKMIILK